MKKEQTEEQVQDHLQEETGGGSNYHSFEVTKSDKAIVWITIAVVVAFAIAVLLII